MKAVILFLDGKKPFAEYSRLLPLISEERCERIAQMSSNGDRVRSLFAELLIRYEASEQLGADFNSLRFEKNEFGKPFIIGRSGYDFSVSHSGNAVAFAGKSNVGKSSLINGLMNRKSLARTSAQPGKTQTINYYNINDEIYFVDLPGYGYAQANENVKAQWGKMIEDYLHKSKQLKLVFLLIDIRHAPSENDRIMYDWIRRNGYDPIIIATKLDKINRSQIQKQIKLIRTTLQAGADTQIIPYSAQTKQGREEIYEILDGVLAAEDPAQE